MVLAGMIVVLLRVWHLAVIQHDSKVQEAEKPRKKTVFEAAKRGTIHDRFGLPLALNKLKYQAAIYFSHIKEIPTVVWEKNEKGEKVRKQKRKEYIRSFAELLGKELDLDPDRVEDLIYSKAVFYSNLPFILKDGITEKEYYRLKFLEKDWPGLSVRKVPKRFYPEGRVGAEVIGFVGSINQEEYEQIVGEISTLEEAIREFEEGVDDTLSEKFSSLEEAEAKLKELKSRAYSYNDTIGKSGVEGQFEKNLRGFAGKRVYESNAFGHFLYELPGSRSPFDGERLDLSISLELQAHAEKLLIEYEGVRDRFERTEREMRENDLEPLEPWIRGGAVVALDPYTGEVLALASYPRFDPNDFVSTGSTEEDKGKKEQVIRWLEGEVYLAKIWDQILPMERERWSSKEKKSVDESCFLTLDTYLDTILPPGHQVRQGLSRMNSLKECVAFERAFSALLSLLLPDRPDLVVDVVFTKEGDAPFSTKHESNEFEVVKKMVQEKKEEVRSLLLILEPYLTGVKDNYNKLFLLDLARIFVQEDFFSSPLLKEVGKKTLDDYREDNAALHTLLAEIQDQVRILFRENDFKRWREENLKGYLRQKREKEKAEGRYARPYLDYLDHVEKDQFQLFWERHRFDLLFFFLTGYESDNPLLIPYMTHLRKWHEEIGDGAHKGANWAGRYSRLKEVAESLPSDMALVYFNTMRSFTALDRPLVCRYRNLRKEKGRSQEKHLAAAFYPKYGHGCARSYAFREAAVQGSVFKLVTAYETLIQRYYGGCPINDLNPLKIVDQVTKQGSTWGVGYWMNGQPIPRIYKGGRVPKSLSKNIGTTDLVVALERSSNPYFAILAGDYLKEPDDLAKAAALFSYGCRTGIELPGEISGFLPDDLAKDRTNLYATSMGQGTLVVTPLQTGVMLGAFANGGDVLKPTILHSKDENPLSQGGKLIREIDFPEPIRALIFQGMSRAVDTVNIDRLAPYFRGMGPLLEKTREGKKTLIGKTGSAESMEVRSLDRLKGTQKITHSWFGGISFSKPKPEMPEGPASTEKYGDPELVIVVYLRHSPAGGKAALPIATSMALKWKEILSHSLSDR